ncbi:MAG: chemotaxis response regulator protein-glutamate methylesterase [bacterium (Candidatus Stahlbacteria) CG23_combo_of_CG06-09_8_20_14_all_34_7]|nr:MAG: chemotaxis response regulator protein-glutamate methylesterase [bacterium (Candidatus Stahlbacteria) CG23_combo_of_CG06-09_8_20_14_all_34_7]
MKASKVLIVDDSILMRQIIKGMVNSDKSFIIVGEAADGAEAIEKFKILDPDIVTLDIEMPKINGLISLQQMLRIKTVPIIIISAYSATGSKIALKALEFGAFDIIEKPSGSISIDITDKKDEILQKMHCAVKSNLNRILQSLIISSDKIREKVRQKTTAANLVAIASSTGGPKTLMEIIPQIKSNINAGISIVQHMPAGFTKSFSERLNSMSNLNVFESYDNCLLKNGDCVIAQGGRHIVFDENGVIHISNDPPYHSVKPAADIMMLSAIKHYKNRIIGVVLTGMGKDGSEGVFIINKMGGINIAESKETSVVFGMPKAAIETGGINFVLDRDKIAEKIEELTYEMD